MQNNYNLSKIKQVTDRIKIVSNVRYHIITVPNVSRNRWFCAIYILMQHWANYALTSVTPEAGTYNPDMASLSNGTAPSDAPIIKVKYENDTGTVLIDVGRPSGHGVIIFGSVYEIAPYYSTSNTAPF